MLAHVLHYLGGEPAAWQQTPNHIDDKPTMPDHRPPALLLLGPTGSGKTPLGQALELRGWAGSPCVHFDFGENLRQAAGQDEPDAAVSREDVAFLRQILRTGTLLEDDQFPLAGRILRRFLDCRGVGPTTWVVLNGLPRHEGQAVRIAEIVDVRAVVHLSCSADTVGTRIQTDAGGDRRGRTDDDREDVCRKLAIFAARTQPLLDFYRQRNVRVVELAVTSTSTAAEMCARLEVGFLGWPAPGERNGS